MPKFEGTAFRAINPIWARQPLSGEGAARFGGRFNPKGIPALYMALSPDTAIREANQVGHLQPTTLVSYLCNIERVFDTRDPVQMVEFDVALDCPTWRDEMQAEGLARTQKFALALVDLGFSAMLVQSFVRGAGPQDVNLVAWHWGTERGSQITLIDDENRLG